MSDATGYPFQQRFATQLCNDSSQSQKSGGYFKNVDTNLALAEALYFKHLSLPISTDTWSRDEARKD